MSRRTNLVHVTEAKPLHDLVLRVSFSDGTIRDVDVKEFLEGPVFEPLLRDPELFRQVRVESGTVTWPNGADIDPVVLRGLAKPASKESETGPRPAG